MASSPWYVYMIRSMNDRLYTGITTDVKRRWQEHTQLKKGAKFFRMDKAKSIAFVTQVENRSVASQLEFKIKKLTRDEKLQLIDSEQNQIDKIKIYD